MSMLAGTGYRSRGGMPIGDPGLGSFLGKVGKGILSVGGQILSGVLGGGGGAGISGPGVPTAMPFPQTPRIGVQAPTGRFGGTWATVRAGQALQQPNGFGGGGGFSGGGAGGRFELPLPGGGARAPLPMPNGAGAGFGPAVSVSRQVGEMTASGMPGGCPQCPSGFRPNKSSYFLQDGTFVPEKSRCVKIRRRNPLNPRALSRSLARVKSAKNAAKMLSNVSIRNAKRC